MTGETAERLLVHLFRCKISSYSLARKHYPHLTFEGWAEFTLWYELRSLIEDDVVALAMFDQVEDLLRNEY